ncbi:MAG: NAD(P)H-binding protein [Chloroflexota bacterium]|nr:NAD(P)H-binding protein [Chloroflexota bacterium]
MRLTVLGGTGRIGRLVVEQALAAGHDVTVLVRDPAKVATLGDTVRTVVGWIGDQAALADAVVGADAVISALGPDGNRAEEVVALREGMQAIVAAMGQAGVSRIVNLSGAAVDAPGDHKPTLDRIASRIVRLVSGHVVAAKQAEFDELRGSELEWVAVRPPLVTDGPHTGHYRAGEDVLHPGARIGRADIADFMLAQAEHPTFVRRAPFICY